MNTPRFRLVATLSTALLFGALANSAQADPSNKWRVEFGGHATNDGVLVLRLNPVNGKSVDVETNVPARSSNENVARAVADSLKFSLGNNYHVETDDGEDVIIRTTSGAPRFDLSLARSSLTGLEVDIERE
jgi:hypothetical protein